MLRVGLTGGLASGKSSVARALAREGLPVRDADLVVRELYEPGQPGALAIASSFGPEFLDESGAVVRARLGAHVFGHPDRVARLNALIHPLVHAEHARWFEALERAGQRLGVVEATLLLESGGRARFDVVVTVSAPEDVRLARAAARNPEIPVEELRNRMKAQLPDARREELADVVLRNDGSAEELLAKARELARQLRERAAQAS